MTEPISPYQARLYGAVLFGERHARAHAFSLIRRLWTSRRWWQARAIEFEQRLRLIEALCAREQIASGDRAVGVRADIINHALDPHGYGAPEEWADAVEVAREYFSPWPI